MFTTWILAVAASAADSSFGLGVAGTYDFGIAVVGGDFDGDGLSDLAAAGRTLASGLRHAGPLDTQTADPSGLASFVVDLPSGGLLPGDTAWFVGISVMAGVSWTAVERSEAAPVVVTAPGTTH